MQEPLVTNVSDTARWVAVYRALESARADPLFRDPYADRLAGERGRAIAAQAPRGMRGGWPLVVRTKLVDDLVLTSVAEGCDRVLNLAAGFDTRPYRMKLPPELRWIEADLPAMVDEKQQLLRGEAPMCHLTREKVDLSETAARASFLEEALRGSSNALVITEGLLTYLDDEQVRALGRDLAARAAARWWLLDVTSPRILQMMKRGMGSHLQNAPMKFAPADGIAFFEALGWRPVDVRSVFREAIRHKRVPTLLRLFAFLPEPNPRKPGGASWSAVVRFERR